MKQFFLALGLSLITSAACATKFTAIIAAGDPLPSGSYCASNIDSYPEVRSENYTANHTVPQDQTIDAIDGASSTFNAAYADRVKGNFTGTTEEILAWASCKWGFPERVTKARAVTESYWRQGTTGDQTSSQTECTKIGKTAPCYQSYGILQIKGTVHEDTYPRSKYHTAWNADYAMAWQRACYNGDFTWLGSEYTAGDMWGCVGAWFSGNWYDSAAIDYIEETQGYYDDIPWNEEGFEECISSRC